MTKTTLTASCFLGAIALATASAQDPAVIKLVPTKGQVVAYSMTGSLVIGANMREVLAKRVDTVLDVNADGSYKSKWEEQDVTVDGEAVPDQPEGTTVSKPSGEIISIEDPDSGRAAALERLYYPTAPVKIGDTWSYEGKKNDKLGVLDFKADMKLLGDEKVGAFDTWKIQEDVKETVNVPPATLHATVWVDKKDGWEVKLQSKFTDFPLTSAIPEPINGTLNYLRN
jgi:hypothetical protein